LEAKARKFLAGQEIVFFILPGLLLQNKNVKPFYRLYYTFSHEKIAASSKNLRALFFSNQQSSPLSIPGISSGISPFFTSH